MIDVTDAAVIAQRAKDLVEKLPVPLLGPLVDMIEGLLADEATKARRAAGLLVARAHKVAVETAIKKARA